MFKILMPDAFKIETRRLHEDTWILEYTESFSEEKWGAASGTRDYTINNVRKMLGDYGSLDVDEENRSITFKTVGPQKLIFNMLAGEFILGSTLGEMKLKDLVGLAAYKKLPYVTHPDTGVKER